MRSVGTMENAEACLDPQYKNEKRPAIARLYHLRRNNTKYSVVAFCNNDLMEMLTISYDGKAEWGKIMVHFENDAKLGLDWKYLATFPPRVVDCHETKIDSCILS